ncbi:MAG: xylose isomerase [Spirochaetes bacterium]|nr:xylose isomerase [Spirochaetota bacterium]
MKDYFPDISTITYEGNNSKNPYSFKYYKADKKIGSKTMHEHLKFALAYWHTLTGKGVDPFGADTMIRPWDNLADPMDKARARVDASFELMQKLGIRYFCLHDRDIAPEAATLKETNRNLDILVELIGKQMKATGIKLLWGTANMFLNSRYLHGAATSCNADVFAYAGAQVKKAMEITKELGGANYVFWGGREGYETLLNTDMDFELDNQARLLRMAIDYAKEIGFTGQFLIEPKPKEPTKHQYDFDVASVMVFLRKYGLDKDFKINIESNHATLAGHTFQHELCLARINNMLGSIDANQGDPLLGWDTDQYPTDVYNATLAMYEVLKNGGLHSGGINFDAKPRRASFEPSDLFLCFIAGMDTYAKGLEAAYKLLNNGELEDFIRERYSSYSSGIGKDIVEGKAGLKELEEYALQHDRIINNSGRQELLETIVNRYIL